MDNNPKPKCPLFGNTLKQSIRTIYHKGKYYGNMPLAYCKKHHCFYSDDDAALKQAPALVDGDPSKWAPAVSAPPTLQPGNRTVGMFASATGWISPSPWQKASAAASPAPAAKTSAAGRKPPPQKKGMPRWLSITLSVMFFLGAFLGVVLGGLTLAGRTSDIPQSTSAGQSNLDSADFVTQWESLELEAQVRAYLQKPTGDIRASELDQVTELSLYGDKAFFNGRSTDGKASKSYGEQIVPAPCRPGDFSNFRSLKSLELDSMTNLQENLSKVAGLT